MIKKVLSIAGSDCSGGAGIEADIKTITVHKMYAMAVLTALTAQNTLGVTDILEADSKFVGAQLDCVFTDIFPDSVKIGMVANGKIIEKIAERLDFYNAKNIVVDPVMVSTSGSNLMNPSAKKALTSKLLPMARVITPNIPEAEILANMKILGEEDMIKAAKFISKTYDCAVLVKGGHLINDAVDYLYENGHGVWFSSTRVDNPNTHGTGCTLSSAIACNLAAGMNLHDSIKEAKKYLTGALKAGLDLGSGSGPLDHTYNLK